MTEKVIYTIGHSNIDIKKFIDLLKHNNIEIVVDVRSAPYSKYAPHFNKENIKQELEKEGIGYVFMGGVLGGRPKQIYDNEFHTADVILDVKYKKIMEQDWYQNGVSKLMEIASTHNAAVMCSEENPNKCHRHLLITPSLLNKGVKVMHLRGNGNIEYAKKHAPQVALFQ